MESALLFSGLEQAWLLLACPARAEVPRRASALLPFQEPGPALALFLPFSPPLVWRELVWRVQAFPLLPTWEQVRDRSQVSPQPFLPRA